MENRIKINGEWYVREANFDVKERKPIEPIMYRGCSVETDDYLWEVEILDKYSAVGVSFTDKTVDPNIKEHWDNDVWLIGVRDGNPESIRLAKQVMNDKGIEDFRNMLHHLTYVGWLNIGHK
jgi:hypothetical protein